MVAIFYCFVNSEVKNTFKHHFLRWNDARNLRTGGSRRFTYSKDWSPNTRSDSVRYLFLRAVHSPGARTNHRGLVPGNGGTRERPHLRTFPSIFALAYTSGPHYYSRSFGRFTRGRRSVALQRARVSQTRTSLAVKCAGRCSMDDAKT